MNRAVGQTNCTDFRGARAGTAVAVGLLETLDRRIGLMGMSKVGAACWISCLLLGAFVSRDAGAQWSTKGIDDGRVGATTSTPPAPFVWFKFDGDLKDATGHLPPLEENYEWMKTSTFGPGRNGQAKTWMQWSKSITAPHLVGRNVGTFFVRDAYTVALAVRGVYWGAATEVARATGRICASNTLFSVRNIQILVYGCGAAATTGFLKIQLFGRDGDGATIGGGVFENKGIAVVAGRYNDVFVSYDPTARKATAWLNGVAVGSASVSPPATGTSILRVGPMTEGSIDDIKYWPQALTPASFQSTPTVAP
jgi:hypothetical protein